MRLADLTSVGRAIDPAYPTNLALIVLVSAVGVATGIWQNSAIWGLRAGIAVFFGWALTRELDPEREMAAFVSAFLVILMLLLVGLPDGPMFWLLLAMRVVNRTTGLAATWLDSLLLLALALGSPWLLLLTAVFFTTDGWLSPPHHRQYLFAAISVAAAVHSMESAAVDAGFVPETAAVALILSAIGGPLVFACREVRARGDATEETLRPLRVQAAQLLAMVAATVVSASSGLMAMAPFWSALVGACLQLAWQTPLGARSQRKAATP